MDDSQVLLIVGLLLLIVGLRGAALKVFGAEMGAHTGRTRLVAVALGLGLLAAWMWLPLPGSRHAAEAAKVDTYQQRVLATCADIRNQQTGGADVLRPDGVDRDAFVSLVDRQLAFQRVAWSRLWDVDAPEELVDEREAARRDVGATLKAIKRLRNLVAGQPQDVLSQSLINDIADQSGALDNAAMATASLSDLAGESCVLTS